MARGSRECRSDQGEIFPRRNGHRQWWTWAGVEEQSADDDVVVVVDADLHVSGEVPRELLAAGEVEDVAGVDRRAGVGVDDLDALAADVVPVPVADRQQAQFGPEIRGGVVEGNPLSRTACSSTAIPLPCGAALLTKGQRRALHPS